jgi:hypothetical protein
MYKCELHGELESEWCDDSHVTEIRFKDLEYDCTDGPRTFTMYLLCCETCGNRFDIRLK